MSRFLLSKNYLLVILLLFVFIPPTSASFCFRFNQLPKNYAPAFDQASYRAFSISQAQSAIADKECDKKIIQQIQTIGGITHICGFVFNEKSNEVILHGMVEKDAPAIAFDDFIIALRNIWLKYAKREGNTITYSYPGCSIDPNPDVLKKLRSMEVEIMSSNDTQKLEKIIKKWMETCRAPQSVRVLGMPFNCSLAKVLVDADYHMKRVTDGTDSLGIPGLISYTSLMLEDAKRCALSGKPLSVFSTANRFWFYPGDMVVEKEKNSYLLTDCRVVLLTELQYARTTIQDASVDRLAERFAADFTALFDQIAEKRPIYKQLEQEFQLVAAAKSIYAERSGSTDGLDYLLNDYPLGKCNVEPRLAGNPSISRFSHTSQTGNMIRTVSLRQPSCGGVAINAEPKIQEGPVEQIGLAVISARPSPKAVSWECASPAVASVIQRYRTKKLNRNASSASMQIRNSDKGYSLLKDGIELSSNDGRVIFNDIPELFPLIKKQISGSNYTSVCFEPVGFKAEKLEAFASTLRTQVWLNDKNGQVRIIPIETTSGNESGYLLEMLLTPGIRYYKEEKNEIVELGENTPHKGFFSTTLRFAGQVGKNIKKYSLEVIGKTKALVLDFVGITNQQFVDSNTFPGNFSELAEKFRKELAEKRKISEGELFLQLKDELENTQCVFIYKIDNGNCEQACRAH